MKIVVCAPRFLFADNLPGTMSLTLSNPTLHLESAASLSKVNAGNDGAPVDLGPDHYAHVTPERICRIGKMIFRI
jgi:hypothetical protein